MVDRDKTRLGSDEYDKGDLKDELKRSGFDEDTADYIADIVNDRKAKQWSQMLGRQEAVREIKVYIDSLHTALQTFEQNYLGQEEPVVTQETKRR